MALSYEECLRQGLLRKIPASKDTALRSLHKAQRWLEEAKRTLASEAVSATVLAAYLAMFHAARAILTRMKQLMEQGGTPDKRTAPSTQSAPH